MTPREITEDLDLWDGEQVAPFRVVGEVNPGRCGMRGVEPDEAPFIEAIYYVPHDGDREEIERLPTEAQVEARAAMNEALAQELIG